MRLDRFLWFVRLARSRAAAQALAEQGLLRIDGRRIDRSAAPVRIGSVLAFPLSGQVRVVRIAALPRRRGPPAEARACYQDLKTPAASPAAPAASEPVPFLKNVSQEAASD